MFKHPGPEQFRPGPLTAGFSTAWADRPEARGAKSRYGPAMPAGLPKPTLFQRLLAAMVRRQEKVVGEPLDYLKPVIAHTPGLVLKLGLLGPLGNHRHALPPAAKHVAVVRATLREDCGACAQMAVNLAKAEGVADDLLRAVVYNRLEELPPGLADICRWVDELQAGGDPAGLRENLRAHYGEAGLIELSLAFSLAAFFPRFKKGLGAATTCALHPVRI